MAPGRKFSTRTSERSASRATRARPASFLRSTARLRLFRWIIANGRERPVPSPMRARMGSPPSGSTLITSAPRSERIVVQYGPARAAVTSSTRTPARNAVSVIGAVYYDPVRSPPGMHGSTPTTMRAAVISEIGAAPEIVEVPVPTRGTGEALVRVSASALQPVDLIVATGRFYDGLPDVPFTPGLEAIGTVVEAETLAPGTRVRVEIVHPGYGIDGGCSEYVVVPEAPTGNGDRHQTSLQVVAGSEL